MNKKFDLTGKTAVVTGGGRGLGYSMSRALAEAGAKVLIASRNEMALKESAEKLMTETGGEVIYASVDLSDRNSTKELVEKARKLLGHVDIFIGNAAMEKMEWLEDITDEGYNQIMEVNVAANIFLMKGFIPLMKEKNWGRIIFITSATAKVSGPDMLGVYSASKSALHALARVASVELGPHKITVNSVVPGVFLTDMTKEVLASYGEEQSQVIYNSQAQITAENRWGKPEELEGAILLLASDAGSYITGSELCVDGGFSSRSRP